MISREHVISIFLQSLVEIRLGYLDFWFFYRIVYFGVVFDLVFQKCINSRTYVFSNSNCSLIEFLAVFFSMRFFICSRQIIQIYIENIRSLIRKQYLEYGKGCTKVTIPRYPVPKTLTGIRVVWNCTGDGVNPSNLHSVIISSYC